MVKWNRHVTPGSESEPTTKQINIAITKDCL